VSRRYEVLFIVRPDIGDASIKEEIERARRVLEQQGAAAIEVHDWGLRDLAYRIETHRRGWYVLIEYEAMPRAVAELERTLKLSEHILRFVSVRQPKGAAHAFSADQLSTAELSAEALAEEGLQDADEGEM